MQWKIDLSKRDEEALQKAERASEAQEQKEERARVAQEMRDAALREEMAKQSEEQRTWESQRQRQHFLAQNLPKYDGHEQLDTILQRFEEILTGEGVPMEQWMQLLTRALTGKPATLLTTVLSPEAKASYPLTKEALLASVDLSFHHYVDELFTPHKENDTTPEMALHHSSTVAKFIFKDTNNLDDHQATHVTPIHPRVHPDGVETGSVQATRNLYCNQTFRATTWGLYVSDTQQETNPLEPGDTSDRSQGAGTPTHGQAH